MSDLIIKPCPFCGHADVEICEVEPGRIAIDCPECECIGPFGDSVEDAAELWNIPTIRLEVLEREHAEFFERWHGERRKREALELLCHQLYEAERDKNQQDWTAVIRALEKVGAGDTPMARLFGCCADDEDKTQNVKVTGSPALSASPCGLPGYAAAASEKEKK